MIKDALPISSLPQNRSAALLLGKGDGTFKSPLKFCTFRSHGWLEAGDFNGSDALDLAPI